MAKEKKQTTSAQGDADLLALRARWKHLYHDFLPSMAKAKDSAQSPWPVVLDHCFARIVLDNVVGEGERPWTDVIGKPAIEKMDAVQLKGAIALAEKIAQGEVDLVDLDERSLSARGKKSKRKHTQVVDDDRDGKNDSKKQRLHGSQADSKLNAPEGPTTSSIKHENGTDDEPSGTAVDGGSDRPKKSTKVKQGNKVSTYFQSITSREESRSKPDGTAEDRPSNRTEDVDDSSLPHFLSERSTSLNPDIAEQLRQIAANTDLTPFRKETLSLLCQIPRGRWSTYGAMSTYINRARSTGRVKSSESANKSTCARAIGSAMKNNPFAPGVPCHRVLASGGSLGGFGGSWGEDGKYAEEKKRLLREEGVKFNGRGKAIGEAFTGFTADFHSI